MTGKTHCMGGVLLNSVLLYAVSLANNADVNIVSSLPFLLCGAVGALLPDIDEPNSTISHKLPLLSGAFSLNRRIKKRKAAALFQGKAEKEKTKRELRDASHRGITHYLITWLVPALMAFLLIFLADSMRFSDMNIYCLCCLFGVILGGFSHILLDMISGKIPCFAPFTRKSFGVCIFRTGGILEKYVFRIVVLGAILFVWKEMFF